MININRYIDNSSLGDGVVTYSEYDHNGNEIHTWWSSNGYTTEAWGEFDSHGNNTYVRTVTTKPNGTVDIDETWFEYDSDGREIHSYDSKGYEKWY